MRGAARGLPVSLLAVLAISAAVPRAEAPPLTNEDVVRMLAAGRGEAEIRRAIQSAERVAFDLDPEMVVELKRVGVTEVLLTTMRERQARMPAPPATHAPAPAPVPTGTVELRYVARNPKKPTDRPKLELPVEPERGARMLPGISRKDVVEEIALFLLCGTAIHVPDHWADLTELKDFTRHEKLLFQPGSHAGKVRGKPTRELEFPESLPAEVPAGTHRLLVGVAVKIGPRWVVVASAERPEVPVEAGRKTILTVSVGDFRLAAAPKPGEEAKPEPEFTIRDVTPPSGAAP